MPIGNMIAGMPIGNMIAGMPIVDMIAGMPIGDMIALIFLLPMFEKIIKSVLYANHCNSINNKQIGF